jgi:hypothetical protein
VQKTRGLIALSFGATVAQSPMLSPHAPPYFQTHRNPTTPVSTSPTGSPRAQALAQRELMTGALVVMASRELEQASWEFARFLVDPANTPGNRSGRTGPVDAIAAPWTIRDVQFELASMIDEGIRRKAQPAGAWLKSMLRRATRRRSFSVKS